MPSLSFFLIVLFFFVPLILRGQQREGYTMHRPTQKEFDELLIEIDRLKAENEILRAFYLAKSSDTFSFQHEKIAKLKRAS